MQTDSFPQGIIQMREERRKWKQDFYALLGVKHGNKHLTCYFINPHNNPVKYYTFALEVNKQGLRELE